MKKLILLLLTVALFATSVLSMYSCKNNENEGAGEEEKGETDTGKEDDGKTDEKNPTKNTFVKKYNYGSIDYWLYEPDTDKKDLPLIVYLHDYDEGKDGVDGMITQEGLTKTLYEGGYSIEAYVLMPNLSKKGSTWYGMRDDLKNLISFVSSSKSTDSSRTYLTGAGDGATGVYKIAMSMPTAFAAIAPVGGEVDSGANEGILRDVKITAYISADLEDHGVESAMDFMFRLGGINSDAEVVTLDRHTRESFSKVYTDSEYNLLDALIER